MSSPILLVTQHVISYFSKFSNLPCLSAFDVNDEIIVKKLKNGPQWLEWPRIARMLEWPTIAIILDLEWPPIARILEWPKLIDNSPFHSSASKRNQR